MKFNWRLTVLSALVLVAGAWSATVVAKDYLAYGGGPVGGTFNYIANAMAIYLSKNLDDVEVSSEGSGGSTLVTPLL